MAKENKTTVKELKNKFRQTKAWKEFRSEMKEYCHNIDYITQSKLLRGANLHHKVLLKSSKNVEQVMEHYMDISDKDNFVFLNKTTHETVHFLFKYYIKDEQVIDRLREVLQEMKNKLIE